MTTEKRAKWSKNTVCLSSDWQFADYARLSKMTEKGITSRLTEFVECFVWMVKLAADRGVYSHIILGDLFDDRVAVPVTVLDTVCGVFADAAPIAEFDILVGNHDAALRSPHITSLRALQGFATIHYAPRAKGPFGFVPWVDDADRLSNWCAQVADAGARFLCAHVMVQGAVPNAKALPPSALHPECFERVLLGDVHDPVAVKPNIQYIGAPLHINFGDAGKKRGIWFLDTDTGAMEFVENTRSPKFHNITARADLANVDPKDYVKVRIEDYDAASEVITTLLEDGFDGWIQSEAVEVEDSAPRLEVQSKDRIEDVLRRYCDHVGVKDTDAMVALGKEIIDEAKVQ